MSIKPSNLKIGGIILLGIIALLVIIVPAIIYLQTTPSEDADFSATTSGDRSADAKQKAFLEKYPIINELPIIYAHYDEQYNYTEFRIDGGEFDECPIDFCLKITDTTGGNYEFARELIKDAGFNTDDYEILYEYKPIIPLE